MQHQQGTIQRFHCNLSSHCILEYFATADTVLESSLSTSPISVCIPQVLFTEDDLILATNRWLLAKSERKHTGIVMVYMSKAFNRVDHRQLVQISFEFELGGAVVLFIPVQKATVCQNQRPDFSASSMLQRCSSRKCTWTSLFVLYISDIVSVPPVRR